MKTQTLESSLGSSRNQKMPKTILLLALSLFLITLLPLYYPFQSSHSLPSSSTDNHYNINKINIDSPELRLQLKTESAADHSDADSIEIEEHEKCDIFTGEWIPNPDGPYYNHTSCWAIHEHQNCIKYGRPDLDFLKWRWKPDGCDLPHFNPYQFLELVRGKSMAFVGDELGRNHMQSFICMLSRVEYPYDKSPSKDENFKRWWYRDHNFTLSMFFTPFLVKSEEATANVLYNLYLDEVDEKWASHIQDFDYVIINSGHWFTRPVVYYEKGNIIGCKYCQMENVTDYPMTYGYRKAIRTTLRAMNHADGFKGVMFLRTFSPLHFENGGWNDGGDCARTKPYKNNEVVLEGMNLELYMTQMEEFKAAEREAKRRRKRFRMLDLTPAMLLRADGHPSRYGQRRKENETLYNDCVHWCLPGPIDTWSDFLLQMMKTEGWRSYQETLQFKQHSSKDRNH